MCCNIETLEVLTKPAVLSLKIFLIRDQWLSLEYKGLACDIRFIKRHHIPLNLTSFSSFFNLVGLSLLFFMWCGYDYLTSAGK